MEVTVGKRLGPYEIVSRIGAGGMGEVWRARDTRLDRSVAIKVLSTDFAGQADLRARFDREARTISQLNHPNICTLYDVGHEDGIDYLVMELLEGETLADRLVKGPMPVAEVFRYGAQISDALARAHRQGITHRDLKPGNVMLTKSGAKLLDFGLAKTLAAANPSSAPEDATQHKPLTQEGTVLGTFQYMAPEQLAGEAADARTDIFSLGAVLYEMATGTPAFSGKNRTSLIANILGVNPRPISELQPLTPPALERLIQRCLAKDPDDRWQSAADVAEEMKWLGQSGVSGISTSGTRVNARRGDRTAWVVAAIATAAAIGFFVASQMARRVVPPPIFSTLAPAVGNEMWFGGPTGGALTISPDSRYMTYVGTGADGIGRIWVRDLRSRDVRALAGTENGEYPFWSPDSRHLGFFVNRKLKKIPVEGGASVEICDVYEPRGGSWGRDGVIVLAPHWRGPISRVSATGGKPVEVTKLDPSRNETTHRWPSFLPDGKHFLYFVGSHTADTTSGDNAIWIGSTEGGEPRLLLRARSNVTFAAGHLLFLLEQRLVAQRFDPDSFELEGDAVTLAEGVRYEKGFFRAVFAASETMLMYQIGGMESKVLTSWINRKGETIGSLADSDLNRGVSIAPNGKMTAVVVGDPGDIWLYDLVRGTPSRFTFDPWQEMDVVWSPDSKTLLYWSDRDTQLDIFRKSIGSPETLWLGDKSVDEVPLDWSTDGRFILVAKTKVGGREGSDLWIHPDVSGEKAVPFKASPFHESDGRFSPDGKLIAYVSDESGRNEIYVASFPEPTETLLISSKGGVAPRWRGDGRELYFIAGSDEILSVPIVSSLPLATGPPTSLFRAPIAFEPNAYYDVTADGEKFLIVQPEVIDEEPLTLVANWTSVLKQK